MFESRVSPRLALALLATILSSCAADPNYNYPDAGPQSCRMGLSFVTQEPVAPTEIFVIGDTFDSDGYSWRTFTWTVTDPFGTSISVFPQGLDGNEMVFSAELPGTYRVQLDGEIDYSVMCDPADEPIYVADPDARTEDFLLRFLPAAGQAPVQERIVSVTSGPDIELGEVALERGVEVVGLVIRENGSPLAAYVRASVPGGRPNGLTIERFTDGAGAFAIRVENRRYDYLVVPVDNNLAPQRFQDRLPDELDFVVAPGLPITGSVTDAGGVAVVGTGVSLRVDEIPSTLATTDATGAFALSARAGAPASLAVVPPAGAGLFELSLPTSAGLNLDASSSPISVSYGADMTSRVVNALALAADGATSAPGTRITFIARPVAGAGQATTGAGANFELVGHARVSVTTDGAGMFSAQLPEAEYDVVLEPADPAHGAASLRYVDLRAGQPALVSVVLDAGSTVSGVVRDASGWPLSDVRISATPLGVLAQTPAVARSTTSADQGAFALNLIAGGRYQVRAQSLSADHVHGWRVIDVPGAGSPTDIGAVRLGPDVKVRGEMRIPLIAGGAAGVSMRVFCLECPEEEQGRALAETVTDGFGQFSLPIPDPGTDP